MKIQKLPWAGIRIQTGSASLAIDPLYHFPAKFGQSHEPMIPLSEFGPVDAVLVTHHHGDHFDPAAIAAYYGADIPVYMPAEGLKFAEGSGLNRLTGVTAGDSVFIGGLVATAVPAVDGVGDPQVSWVVAGDAKRMIHCGDTLWHGYWWRIKQQYGPFDAACLPVNGAVVEFPGMLPSGEPITLTPEQAVSAAAVLEAERLVPIHFKAIHNPPLYRQTPNVTERLQASAAGRVKLEILEAKDFLAL